MNVSASADPSPLQPAEPATARRSRKLRLVVLASGRGTNLAAIVHAGNTGALDAHVVGVFSDKAKSGAIEIAQRNQIASLALQPRQFAQRCEFEDAAFAQIDDWQPDLIVCAGFMRVLGAEVVAPRSQRMINIHPSLLPLYPGLHTHQRALDAGDREHGASVHFMVPALDAGPVIAQTRIVIDAEDDADSLAARLLPREHRLLIASIQLFVDHRLAHDGGRLLIDGEAREPFALS